MRTNGPSATPMCVQVRGGALQDKLLEEAAELRNTASADEMIQEAADVLEVLIGTANPEWTHTLDDIVHVVAEKRTERGGFENRLWLQQHKLQLVVRCLSQLFHRRDGAPCRHPERRWPREGRAASPLR